MFKLIGLTVAGVFFLAGCNEKEEEKINSKSFYMENAEERIAKLKYCDDYPNKKSTDANCINAFSAKTKIKAIKFRNEGISVDYSSAEKIKTKN